MTVVIGGGAIVAPDGPRAGHVVLEGDRIGAVTEGAGPVDIDAAGGWIVPGFIDLQVNGARGIDVTTEPQRIGELGGWLARDGVTAFLPTVVTCAPDVRDAALASSADRSDMPGAVPLGLHLEGPMLAPARRGAHPAQHLQPPALDLVDGWTREAGVAMVTMAPELPQAIDVITALTERGIVVSIGHTDATADEFAAGRAAGARFVTHLFNAMRPFAHRDPGPIGATLADDSVVVGLICDGVHVDPVAVRMAWRALGPARIALVTDAVAALGEDVHAAAPRTADGVLAGSVVPLDRAVRNLVAFTGCTVPGAVATVTSTQADLLGLADRGRLAPGARADVAVLDADLRIIATVVGGTVAWRR